MTDEKTVLTTGQVAKICNVAPRTVSKWFDSGRLRGYRIPGSKDRRIPVDQLMRFMRNHGMPLNGLGGARSGVVILDGDSGLAEALADALARHGGYEVHVASSVIEAGAVLGTIRPDVMIVDVTLADVVPRSISRWVRSEEELRNIRLIAMAPQLGRARGEALRQDGFDAYLSKPFDVESLVRLIEDQASAPVG